MKANELRIGNYILSKGNSETITGVYQEGIKAKGGKIFGLYEIAPIPLTEEWLLNFGFYKHYVTKEDNQIWRKDWQEGYFDLEQITSFYFGHPCYSVCVTEIHQLQNLFYSLCGEELQLKE